MRNTGYGDGGNAMSTMSNSVRRLLEEGATQGMGASPR